MIPEGYEWPVWPNDGEPVRIGDWYTMGDRQRQVKSITFEEGFCTVDQVSPMLFDKDCEHMPDPPMVSQARLALEDYMCALDDRPAELTRVLEMLQDMEERI